MREPINPASGKVTVGSHFGKQELFLCLWCFRGHISEHPSHGIRRAGFDPGVFLHLCLISSGMLCYSSIFQAIPSHSMLLIF